MSASRYGWQGNGVRPRLARPLLRWGIGAPAAGGILLAVVCWVSEIPRSILATLLALAVLAVIGSVVAVALKPPQAKLGVTYTITWLVVSGLAFSLITFLLR